MKPKGQLRIISGEDRGKRLMSPGDDRIRPTSGMAREAIFSILQDWIPECSFLDLYAGTGSVGLEALSRGAKTVTLVDSDKAAFPLLQKNIGHMTRSRDCRLYTQTAQSACERFAREEKVFDVIFVDPPYDQPGVPLKLLEPLLAPTGVLLYQRPLKWAVGNPFKATQLVEYDSRRYGKTTISFWTFPDNLLDSEEALSESAVDAESGA
jgi:16S rRNA (guanine966-N2)-methyltransferase